MVWPVTLTLSHALAVYLQTADPLLPLRASVMATYSRRIGRIDEHNFPLTSHGCGGAGILMAILMVVIKDGNVAQGLTTLSVYMMTACVVAVGIIALVRKTRDHDE